ncbi:MAG: D-alanyl-D-alanine carboxypeptidase [Lachnospiraceae bacterium]|nr:D-alanyl-D-alanine carboxypeptidase [Lachnospiraceae bacterium]
MKIKKQICGFVAFVLLLSQVAMITKAEEELPEGQTLEEIMEEKERIRQESFDTPPETNRIADWPEGPHIYGHAAILMEMNSGAILYAKRAEQRFYPASITKLLTTLVALENSNLEDVIVFSEESIAFLQWDYAHISVQPGEELTMEQALYALLLASANEVGYGIAETIGTAMGGDHDTFLEQMNTRAQEIGAMHSHWSNAHGLHGADHYTTAYDMALIMAELYQNPAFLHFMSCLEYKIPETNKTEEERFLFQNHQMLWPENYWHHPYVTGGKTGFTNQAGTTLVTTADNETMQLVAVVLHDYGVQVYNSTAALLDYGFDNFVPFRLDETGEDEFIQAFLDPDAVIVLPRGMEFDRVERKIVLKEEGDLAGRAYYSFAGQMLGVADVIVTQAFLESLLVEEIEEEDALLAEIYPYPRGDIADDQEVIYRTLPIFVIVIALGAIVLFFMILVVLVRRKRELARIKRQLNKQIIERK